ncbi:MAG: 50S ribosomal protein L15 [Sedimentisphaerales bacterium]|nr:50S ribosomal protein L15 [Sedimentisphaerales bacterium]
MMSHEITALVGKHKTRRRKGRGRGSGLGKTCGRGHKGQLSRSGKLPPITKEGGQMPLFRRLPKRGFSNVNFTCRYAIVNVSQLDGFSEGSRIDAQVLSQAGLIRSEELPVKILGNGELNRKLTVVAHKFSRSAEQKITSAGGNVELVNNNT